MRIELVIDELRLDGFDPRDRHAIGDAVEREVAALLASRIRGLAGLASGAADVVDGGRFDLGTGAGNAGRAIAGAVMAAVFQRSDANPPRIAGAPRGTATLKERG